MNIAITLVHNKTDKENFRQIEELKTLISEVEDSHNNYSTFHHIFNKLEITHKLKIYQVIPYGVTPPSNRYDINSGGIVQYREGDEDKTGENPRFINWGNKRSFEQGADINFYIDDISKFDLEVIKSSIQDLNNENSPNEFDELSSGKLMTKKLFKEKGQLDEEKTINESINEKYKNIKNG